MTRLGLVVVLLGCSGSVGTRWDAAPGADAPFDLADAPPGTPDAPIGLPDAPPGTPDAPPGLPDAGSMACAFEQTFAQPPAAAWLAAPRGPVYNLAWSQFGNTNGAQWLDMQHHLAGGIDGAGFLRATIPTNFPARQASAYFAIPDPQRTRRYYQRVAVRWSPEMDMHQKYIFWNLGGSRGDIVNYSALANTIVGATTQGSRNQNGRTYLATNLGGAGAEAYQYRMAWVTGFAPATSGSVVEHYDTATGELVLFPALAGVPQAGVRVELGFRAGEPIVGQSSGRTANVVDAGHDGSRVMNYEQDVNFMGTQAIYFTAGETLVGQQTGVRATYNNSTWEGRPIQFGIYIFDHPASEHYFGTMEPTLYSPLFLYMEHGGKSPWNVGGGHNFAFDRNEHYDEWVSFEAFVDATTFPWTVKLWITTEHAAQNGIAPGHAGLGSQSGVTEFNDFLYLDRRIYYPPLRADISAMMTELGQYFTDADMTLGGHQDFQYLKVCDGKIGPPF